MTGKTIAITIRRATPADWDRIAAVHHSSILELGSGHYPKDQLRGWIEAMTTEKFRRRRKERDFLVAEDAGEIYRRHGCSIQEEITHRLSNGAELRCVMMTLDL